MAPFLTNIQQDTCLPAASEKCLPDWAQGLSGHFYCIKVDDKHANTEVKRENPFLENTLCFQEGPYNEKKKKK